MIFPSLTLTRDDCACSSGVARSHPGLNSMPLTGDVASGILPCHGSYSMFCLCPLSTLLRDHFDLRVDGFCTSPFKLFPLLSPVIRSTLQLPQPTHDGHIQLWMRGGLRSCVGREFCWATSLLTISIFSSCRYFRGG